MSNIIDNNKSYTNKDFQSIYTELLDLVPKLTNKWNPATSNEADPGVVLIKLMAVLGDKLNYNIDKQVLECFPGTVTQRENARKLYDLIGYSMKWFNSATTTLNIQFRGDDQDDFGVVTIPRFTQITDPDKQLSFVTLEPVTFDTSNKDESRYEVKTVNVMQGNLVTLKVNDSDLISIADLDENLRIYLNDSNIAENGIFVADAGTDIYDWQSVTNIDAYPLNSKVFEFKVSSDETHAYLQFPTDIATLFQTTQSLTIKYLVSNGEEGNIAAYSLTNFADNIYTENKDDITTKFAISQPNIASYGSDPESVDDAYRNSRKIIGTFNTLITRGDYQNYIRRLMNERTGSPLVSNCVVADRTTDLNKTYKLATLQNFRSKYYISSTMVDRNIKTNDNSAMFQENVTILPYDIVIYMLTSSQDYEMAFTPVVDANILYDVGDAVADAKAANQVFRMPQPGTSERECKYTYLNKYTLKGQIVTTDKLSEDEAEDLNEKVKAKLQNMYSAFNVEFGESIDYIKLIEAIKDADPRIKTVALDNPVYQIHKNILPFGEGATVTNIPLTEEDKVELVARTICAGNLQLYTFNDYFKLDLGQETYIDGTTPILANTALTNIKAQLDISLQANVEKELVQNEIIQLMSEKYYTAKEYSLGCIVYPNTLSQSIVKDEKYTIKAGDSITVTWTASNGLEMTDTLQVGDQIQCSVALAQGVRKTLISGQSLKVYKRADATLSVGTKYIYINADKSIAEVKITKDTPLVLDTNESFIYTNETGTELLLLGSGTKISLNASSTLNEITLTNKVVESEKINASDISSIDWSYLTASIDTIEHDIISLTDGCSIKIDKAISKLGSAWQSLNAIGATQIIVTDQNGSQNIQLNQTPGDYLIRTQLNIVAADTPACLVNENQSIVLTGVDGIDYTITGSANKPVYVQFSIPVAFTSNATVDASNINVYAYAYRLATSNIKRVNGVIALTGDSDIWTQSNGSGSSKIYTCVIPSPFVKSAGISVSGTPTYLYPRFLLPISCTGLTRDGDKLRIYGTNDPTSHNTADQLQSMRIFPNKHLGVVYDNMGESANDNNSGELNSTEDIAYCNNTYNHIVVEVTVTSSSKDWSVSFGDISVVDSINVDEINANTTDVSINDQYTLLEKAKLTGESEIITADLNHLKDLYREIRFIENRCSGGIPYNYTLRVNSTNKCIQPTISGNYFNVNHPYCSYTIPMIDTEKYKIEVNPFSIRKG